MMVTGDSKHFNDIVVSFLMCQFVLDIFILKTVTLLNFLNDVVVLGISFSQIP